MRHWVVASGLIEEDGSLLLVRNHRRDGRVDWSPPGGVIEVADGEALCDGLTREVEEESGLQVTRWSDPLWTVEATAPDLGWHLRVEVRRAVGFGGDVQVGDDPDGIVTHAEWVPLGQVDEFLAGAWRPTREPLQAWLTERWETPRSFRYRVDGARPSNLSVERVDLDATGRDVSH